jgi:hypothetical protein
MLKPQPLNRVSKFNINTKVVGIELQLIAFKQATGLIYIKGQSCRLASGGKPPVTITCRIGFKIDNHAAFDNLAQ